MGKMFKVAAKGNKSIIHMSFHSQPSFGNVKKAAQRGKGNVMRRAGAIVRGIMRKLIRHRKNPRVASPVGTPPFAHFLPGVKNTITFEAQTDRVVIGPQLDRGKPNISPVPGALEYGGYTLVKTFRKKKKLPKRQRAPKGGVWVNGKYYKGGTLIPRQWKPGAPPPSWYKKKNPLQKSQKVRAFIRPRPFANPAMKIFQTSPLYKDIWRDCIK